MARFTYRAVSPSGNLVEGEMEARDQSDVIAQLHSLGHTPIRADELIAGSRRRGTVFEGLSGRQVSRRDIAIFTQDLATLLTAGVPLERALEIFADVTDRDAVRRLVRRLIESVRGGASLADAMAALPNVFPPSYISTVHAGEVGAVLDVVLGRLADYLDKSQQLRETVRSALIYPMILLAMVGVSMVILLTVVLPQFTPLFEDAGAALPWSARVLMDVGEFANLYGWIVILVGAALAVELRRQLRSVHGRQRWHRWILHAPLLGTLITEIEAARFCRTLGTLLGNGVELLAAISVARDSIGNTAVAQAIDQLAPSLKEGSGMAAPLIEAAVFPSLAAHLIRVGEESGQLNAMLDKTADILDREVQQTVERMMAILVPALTIGLGLLVAGIILTILTSILSIYELPF